MSFLMKIDFAVFSRAQAPRPLPTPQPAHRTKGSSDLASSEVTRIAARSAFWEHAAGAGEGRKVVAGPAARTPHPTCAGGQDDGSYTNSLKLAPSILSQS